MSEGRLVDMDNKQMKTLLEIAGNAKVILADNKIYIEREEPLVFIAKTFLDCVIHYLKDNIPEDGSIEVDLFGLFKLGAESQTMEEDENDGNIVPIAEPLKAMKMAFKNDDAFEE